MSCARWQTGVVSVKMGQRTARLRQRSPGLRATQLGRLLPLGYFSMGIGAVRSGPWDEARPRALVLAHGSDWAPQPVTLHQPNGEGGFERVPRWFSEDFDYHMGLAVGDVCGRGFEDVVVAVFAGKDQDVRGGGVKLYRGTPRGLDPRPIWLARGFGATGVALGDLRGSGRLDVVVSVLAEHGTAGRPGGAALAFDGRPRLLVNLGPDNAGLPRFQVCAVERADARGAGDVHVADVDLDGSLDVAWATPRSLVLYGDPEIERGAAWQRAASWRSAERHPVSPCVRVLPSARPACGQRLLSARGLFSMSQARGRSLTELGCGLLLHAPRRGGGPTAALQRLGPPRDDTPELPSGFAVAQRFGDAAPQIFAGFLDARGPDVRGARVRVFRAGADGHYEPDAYVFPGDRLMAGRLVALCEDSAHSVSALRTHRARVPAGPPRRVFTLPGFPVHVLHHVAAREPGGRWREVPPAYRSAGRGYTTTPDGNWLSVVPPLPAGSQLAVHFTQGDTWTVGATSSAAWPPAGASALWRVEHNAGGKKRAGGGGGGPRLEEDRR